MLVKVFATEPPDTERLWTFHRRPNYSGPIVTLSAPEGSELRQFLPDGEYNLVIPAFPNPRQIGKATQTPLTALEAVLAARHGLYGLSDAATA